MPTCGGLPLLKGVVCGVRLLWRSDSPLAVSGYARMTGLFAPLVAALGNEVIISAPGSYRGQPLAYGDCLIIGGARDMHGNDVLAGDYQAHKADALITLCDLFALHPSAGDIARMNALHLVPIDTEPCGEIDIAVLRDGGGIPAAISRHGEKMLRNEGCDPLYIPHGIETALFTPGDPDDGPFTIGINAANKDLSVRKRITNQMLAFARFRERHPEARLKLHTAAQASPGLNLRAVAGRLGITDAVDFPDLYSYATGIIPAVAMADWYRDLDVLSNCSNEGFGLPVLEAQSCGDAGPARRASAPMQHGQRHPRVPPPPPRVRPRLPRRPGPRSRGPVR